MPALFADSGWDKINNTILSTSNCGNPSLRQFGFGPTSGDGFGIGYIIKEDSISICASSKHRQTKRFVDALESYFLEIRKLLRATMPHQTNIKASRAREAEDRPSLGLRYKSKGRPISALTGPRSPDILDESKTESDDDGLGGYGFFDAGMLLHALKASTEHNKEKASESAVGQHRRAVGKKLRLNEY
jgi:carnitine O-acetyltransferase